MREIIPNVLITAFFLLFIRPQAPAMAAQAAAQQHSQLVPVRLDLHLMGGLAKPWAYPQDLFNYAYVIDIDAKALVDKQKVQNRIPLRYRGLFGDELYVGYMFIPRTFAFAANAARSAWSFYVDWNPIGLVLFKTPGERTNAAPASFQVCLNALAAYHLLKHEDDYFHSLRPGLGLRADFRTRITDHVSLKFSAFQNVYWPDQRTMAGHKRDLMPHYSAICAGVVVHIPRLIKM